MKMNGRGMSSMQKRARMRQATGRTKHVWRGKGGEGERQRGRSVEGRIRKRTRRA